VAEHLAIHSDNVPYGGPNYTASLVVLTTLFFAWGFISCLNDILIPHLKSVFSLNYTQAILIQFCFYGAYFIVSLPAGVLVRRIGYKGGIVAGLLVASLGCLMFYPAASSKLYGAFLAALFVLASGITILQVSANPYVASLGNPATASSRMNLTQAFNALGTTVAPFFGSAFILSAAAVTSSSLAGDLNGAETVKMPYIFLALMLGVLALVFIRIDLPNSAPHTARVTSGSRTESAWTQPHLVLGALGIFLYVGAEVAIGSFLVDYLSLKDIGGLSHHEAANYVAYYWGGAMVGRFAGAAIMRVLKAELILLFNAIAAMLLLCIVIFGGGHSAMWSVLLVGLCNSIMFPTIFSLAIRNLGVNTGQGSGILCLAIVGGALVPLCQGVLADRVGLQLAFAVPMFCYGYIVFYAAFGARTGQGPGSHSRLLSQ
tara:strand:+ start:191 stop:1480 length:1290 start_codon:yes stop_codon:yes gene_type:complete